ncbi:MAG: Thiol:disulfide oxidoreductase related to ResA [Labilithrix sp.]|nr:Thiol:disulfide oxidoreductase related to ResA [Labilithrix sp.]
MKLRAAIVLATLVTTTSVLGCARQEGATSPGGGGATTGASVSTGASASDFSARDIEGKNVKLSTYLGKEVVLLNFCATWCEPCVAEFPHLRRMYEANKAKGFIILAVAMDGPETVANVPAFAKRNQLNFPMLTDEDSRIASLYNPKKSAPLSVLIDRSGKVASIREGYNPGDEEFLAKDVAKALDVTAAPQ